MSYESTEDFKARLAAMLRQPRKNALARRRERPCVRLKGQHGIYPPPPMNADPTKPKP